MDFGFLGTQRVSPGKREELSCPGTGGGRHPGSAAPGQRVSAGACVPVVLMRFGDGGGVGGGGVSDPTSYWAVAI